MIGGWPSCFWITLLHGNGIFLICEKNPDAMIRWSKISIFSMGVSPSSAMAVIFHFFFSSSGEV